jgi:hypothetical protein
MSGRGPGHRADRVRRRPTGSWAGSGAAGTPPERFCSPVAGRRAGRHHWPSARSRRAASGKRSGADRAGHGSRPDAKRRLRRRATPS